VSKSRSPDQTQWTAQFAVASELCKRGYKVALTLGNQPTVDLMVVSPNERSFVVDIKGQYRRNVWPVRPKPPRDNLFYIFAFVPDAGDGPNRFFVLTQQEVNDSIAQGFEEYVSRDHARANVKDPMPGVSPIFADQHENRWDKLPS
jgi:hypothetical protein